MLSKRGPRRLRKPAVVALAFLSLLGSASAASARWIAGSDHCSVSAGTLSVSLSADDARSVLSQRKKLFYLNGSVCPGAFEGVDSVDIVDEPSHDAGLDLVVPSKGFRFGGDEISWNAALGDGVDTLTLRGKGGSNSIEVAGTTANFNADSSSTFDLVTSGVEAMELSGGAGDDRLRASDFSGTTRRSSIAARGAAYTSAAALGTYPSARIFGGAGNDTINGDSRVNVIWAGAGNDTVYAAGSDDEVQGGEGDDTLWGGPGDDLINGGPGDDREFGADNNDLFQQGPQEVHTSSDSVVIPEVGKALSSLTVPDTTLATVDVNVRVYIDHPATQDLWVTLISPRDDRVRLAERRGNGTPFNGTHFDSEANTNIRSAGTLNLSGRFHPEWSMEIVQGYNPSGVWKLWVENKSGASVGTIRGWELELGYPSAVGDGSDTLTGGSGALDLAVYTQRTENVTAKLSGARDDGQALENDHLGGIDGSGNPVNDLESVYTGSANDVITGTDGKNDLRGFAGHDTIAGLAEADQIRAGNGIDTVTGDGGNDTIHGQANADGIDGGEGFDRVIYGYSPVGLTINLGGDDPSTGYSTDGESGNDDDTLAWIENISATSRADTITGNSLANVLWGTQGDDYMDGRSGIDNLDGAEGTDTCLNAETTASCEVLFVPDTQPPSVPQSLVATVSATPHVSLAWEASTDNEGVDHYAIYRDGVLLGTSTLTEYVDESVTAGTTYSYSVSALDAAGNESDPSTAEQVVADGQAPSVPQALTATVSPEDDVSLSWEAATDDVGVARYAVYRDGEFLAHTTTTEYVDQAVPTGATYSYRVSALDAADNESERSVAYEVTLGDLEAPTIPGGLTAQALSTSKVQLGWSASTDDSGVVIYDVYRGADLIASTSNTDHVDTSMTPGTTASYTVRARDEAGNLSDPSMPAEATTPAILFFDDFASGDFSTWTSQTNMGITATGDPAALAQSDGSRKSFATKALAESSSTIYSRTRLRINSQGTLTNLLRLRNGGTNPIVSLFSSQSRNLMLRNDFTGSNVWSPKVLELDTWHDLQVRAVVAGDSSEVEVWLDGTRVKALSGTMQLGTNPVNQLLIGDNNLSRTYSVRFDDVTAATGYID